MLGLTQGPGSETYGFLTYLLGLVEGLSYTKAYANP